MIFTPKDPYVVDLQKPVLNKKYPTIFSKGYVCPIVDLSFQLK